MHRFKVGRLKVIVIATGVVASLAFASACSSSSSSKSDSGSGGSAGSGGGTTYSVGLEAPLTGTLGVYGVPQQKGAQVAVDEINSTGYLGKDQLKLNTTDDQSTPAGAIAAFKGFQSGGAIGILCCVASSIGTPLKPLALQSKVPTIITGAAAAGLPQLPNLFRTVYNPAASGSLYDQTVDGAAANWKPQTADLLYTSDSDSFAGATKQVWLDALARNHIKVINQISSLQADTDFSSVATKVVNDKPDLVVADTFVNATSNLMRSLSQFGYKGHTVSSYGVDSDSFFKIAGAAVAGVVFAPNFSALSTNPVSIKFVTEYKAKYNATPDQYAAEGYNSIKFLALGIKGAQAKGKVSRDSVNTALGAVTTWQSTNGNYTMKAADSTFTGKAIFAQWNADGTQSLVWKSGS